MKFYISALFIIFFVTSCAALRTPSYPNCEDINDFEKACLAKLDQLAPTQMNIGRLPVFERAQKIQKLHSEGRLKNYILKRSAPAYLGVNKRIYITDRHHLTSALYHSPIPWSEKRVLVQIQTMENEVRNQKAFLKELEKRGALFLYDNGEQKEIADLPQNFSKLTNDSYRSLVWLMTKTGHLHKPNDAENYFDFKIANQLRPHLDLSKARPSVRKDFIPYLKPAQEIIQSSSSQKKSP